MSVRARGCAASAKETATRNTPTPLSHHSSQGAPPQNQDQGQALRVGFPLAACAAVRAALRGRALAHPRAVPRKAEP